MPGQRHVCRNEIHRKEPELYTMPDKSRGSSCGQEEIFWDPVALVTIYSINFQREQKNPAVLPLVASTALAATAPWCTFLTKDCLRIPWLEPYLVRCVAHVRPLRRAGEFLQMFLSFGNRFCNDQFCSIRKLKFWIFAGSHLAQT